MIEEQNDYSGHYYLEAGVSYFINNEPDMIIRSDTTNYLWISVGFLALPKDCLESLAFLLQTNVADLLEKFEFGSANSEDIETAIDILLDRLSKDGWIIRAFEQNNYSNSYEDETRRRRRTWMLQRHARRNRDEVE